MPYAYYNSFNELVGLDIAMAYRLAQDLHCRLELIPVDIDHLAGHLNDGLYDIAMGAILMNEDRISKMSFSDTYVDQNYALVLPDKKRSQFRSMEDLNRKGIVIGGMGGYKRVVPHNFPNATLYAGTDEKGFEMDKVDAWVSSRIPAAIWCISNSDYYVDDFGGRLGKCYLAYPVKQDALNFLRFLNNWVQIKIVDQFYQEQNDYWVLGKSPAKTQEPRWSIIRNVLHWTE
jgi:ABC-type amino acid transport substrate-binding protein